MNSSGMLDIVIWRAQMPRFEIFEVFDQIFQTTNPALETVKYLKYDRGFDLFDLWAALIPSHRFYFKSPSLITKGCCS